MSAEESENSMPMEQPSSNEDDKVSKVAASSVDSKNPFEFNEDSETEQPATLMLKVKLDQIKVSTVEPMSGDDGKPDGELSPSPAGVSTSPNAKPDPVASPEELGENSKQSERKSTRPKRKVSEAETVVANKKPPPAAKPVSNGSLPKMSGKPMMLEPTKKASKPRKRKKPLIHTYQSEISDNKLGIKLCIKKALSSTNKKSSAAPSSKSKSSRKRSRRPKPRVDDVTDSEDSGFEKRKQRRESLKSRSNNNTVKDKAGYQEPEEQSCWGERLPEHILITIFKNVTESEGCLPSLFRLNKVCSLWRSAALSPQLWTNLDFSAHIRERQRTELNLKWLIENRMRMCRDANLANWKITNVECVLEKLAECCPHLTGLSLSGWKVLTPDNMVYIAQEFKNLERLDLSSVNSDMTHSSKNSMSPQSLCTALQTIGERLTHLYLAHNRLSSIPQIVTSLATHSPNLILLDLSNVSTIAISHGVLHIEKLQSGCQKLKILRITNSHITLNTATLQEQMDSPGFPDLEELSVASLADESRLINDEYLQRILKTSTKLKLLDVRGCARLTHDSLIRLPTWDLKHLFLSGCSVTRDIGSGLELIASKWAHSLIEFDLAWANMQHPLDNCLKALAEKGSDSPLNHLNLCGSSVSLEAVKEILKSCKSLNSINLSSCRGLPRGVKRLLQGATELAELKEILGVTPPKAKPDGEKSPSNAAD